MMKISKEQLKGKTAICVAAQNGGFISNRRFLFFKHWITEGVLNSPFLRTRRYQGGIAMSLFSINSMIISETP